MPDEDATESSEDTTESPEDILSGSVVQEEMLKEYEEFVGKLDNAIIEGFEAFRNELLEVLSD